MRFPDTNSYLLQLNYTYLIPIHEIRMTFKYGFACAYFRFLDLLLPYIGYIPAYFPIRPLSFIL